MLFATSCQKDEMASAQGEVATVSVAVSAPQIATRAYSDGLTATELQYAVYDHAGNYLSELTNSATFNKLNATIELTLTTGNDYDVLFWAAAPNAPYTFNPAEKTVTVNYDGAESNAENRDAFYAKHSIHVTGKQTETVTLTRPFAQLNIGTADYDQSEAAGYVPTLSKVEVTAYDTLNLWNGEVSNPDVRTFDFAAIARNEQFPVVGYEYEYLAMNYLLVGAAKELVEVKFFYKDEAATYTHERTIGAVPVQRNYRTNIFGNLLTSEVDVNVTIDPAYEIPDYNIQQIFNTQDLQAALNAASAGDYIFYLGSDVKGDITILQQEGVNVIIDGCGYKWDGTITINGDARFDGAETVALKSINFESESEKTFISAPTKVNGKYNYSHNITVNGCTFSSPAYNESIVGIKLQTTYNAVIKNSTATNIHTLVQFVSTDNLAVIENVKVVNCKNGIALGNIAQATITGAEIESNGYGIRIDGEKTRRVDVDLTNVKVKAYIPVTVRTLNNDACNVDVELIGEHSLVRTGGDWHIAFCSNEYEEGVDPVNPQGTFRLQNAEEYDVFYGTKTSFSALDAAVNSGKEDTVVVESAISNPGTGIEVERDVILDFANNEYDAGSTASTTWYAIQAMGEYDVVIKNAYFTRAGIWASDGADVVFENGIINHKPERTSRYIFCAQSGSTITIKDGTFTNDRAKNSYFWANNATIYVKGGNFGGVQSNNKVVTSNGGQVIITGGTFNFDPTAWVAAGYVATKSGSTWTVSVE